jgi:hypothetical protein
VNVSSSVSGRGQSSGAPVMAIILQSQTRTRLWDVLKVKQLTRESREAQSLDSNRPCSILLYLQISYTRFLQAKMKGNVQGWMMNQLIRVVNTTAQKTQPRCIYSRANKGRPLLLGVLFIPTARRATMPRSGVPACVEGVPARNSGSAGGAWLIDWPPCSVGVCGSSSSIAIATSSSEEGIGSGDEDIVSGS